MSDWSIQVGRTRLGSRKIRSVWNVVEFKMPIKWPMVMPTTQLDYVDTAIEDGRRGVDDGKNGNYQLMVMEVYIEKKRESGPELKELSVWKDKPAKKTDEDIKGITGEFGVAARKIEDSS